MKVSARRCLKTISDVSTQFDNFVNLTKKSPRRGANRFGLKWKKMVYLIFLIRLRAKRSASNRSLVMLLPNAWAMPVRCNCRNVWSVAPQMINSKLRRFNARIYVMMISMAELSMFIKCVQSKIMTRLASCAVMRLGSVTWESFETEPKNSDPCKFQA